MKKLESSELADGNRVSCAKMHAETCFYWLWAFHLILDSCLLVSTGVTNRVVFGFFQSL